MLKSNNELDPTINVKIKSDEVINHKLLRTVESPEAKKALGKALTKLSILQQTQEAFSLFLDCISRLAAAREEGHSKDIQTMINKALSKDQEKSHSIGIVIKHLINQVDWKSVLNAEAPSIPKKSVFRMNMEDLWRNYSRSLHKTPLFYTEETEVLDMACLFKQLSDCLNIPHGCSNPVISKDMSADQSDDTLAEIVKSILSYDADSLPLMWLGLKFWTFENFHNRVREIDEQRRLENEKIALEKAENQLRYQHGIMNILKALGQSELAETLIKCDAVYKPIESNHNQIVKPSLAGIRYRFLNRDGDSDDTNADQLNNRLNIH